MRPRQESLPDRRANPVRSCASAVLSHARQRARQSGDTRLGARCAEATRGPGTPLTWYFRTTRLRAYRWRRRGATSAPAPSNSGTSGDGRAPRQRGPNDPSIRVVSFRGISTLPGGRGSGLLFDGASCEHDSCASATAVRLALPGCVSTSRSTRPDVSPPRPERGGLASSPAHARALSFEPAALRLSRPPTKEGAPVSKCCEGGVGIGARRGDRPLWVDWLCIQHRANVPGTASGGIQ